MLRGTWCLVPINRFGDGDPRGPAAIAISGIRPVSPLGIKPVQGHIADMSQRRHIPMPDVHSESEGFVVGRPATSAHGLDAGQVFWRRSKIAEISGSVDYFKREREYPLTPDEAFLASNFDNFITADLVMRARRVKDIEPYGPLIIGVDPAGKGADSTAIAWRQGHCITKIEKCHGLDTMEVAGLVAKIIRDDKPVKVNIDVGGLGVVLLIALKRRATAR
jgi:hypothetical protein